VLGLGVWDLFFLAGAFGIILIRHQNLFGPHSQAFILGPTGMQWLYLG
jgi:hypothetical protein